MATEYQVQIATPVQYKKIRGARTAVWARDHSHPITSTMPTPTPYDLATHPFFAHDKPLPLTPRQTPNTTTPTSLVAGRPHASSLRPCAAPREQQDDLYYAFTQNTYNISSPPASHDVSRKLNLYCPRPERKLPPLQRKPERYNTHPFNTSSQKQQPNMEVLNRQLPPLPPKPIAKTSTWASSTFTFGKAGRKKRRPSEIFNINFGFSFPSRRRISSDYSPNVSPRTSISSASGSPPQDILDSFKRQSIDSMDSDVAMVFGIDQEALRMNKQEPLQATPPTSTRCESGEAHPGVLVDFTTSSLSPAAPVEHIPAPLPQTNARWENDTYLSTPAHRRNSFPPGPHRLHPSSLLDTPTQIFFSPLSLSPSLPLSPTSHLPLSPPPLTPGRKRASTLQDTAPTKRQTTSPTTSSLPIPGSSASGSCSMKRSTSDPSTQAFLTHIRASLSKRNGNGKEKCGSYAVFADEDEKGFLGDAPL